MSRVADWCDEATFVDWEQASADLPDWMDSHRRLVESGQGASLTHPTTPTTLASSPPRSCASSLPAGL